MLYEVQCFFASWCIEVHVREQKLMWIYLVADNTAGILTPREADPKTGPNSTLTKDGVDRLLFLCQFFPQGRCLDLLWDRKRGWYFLVAGTGMFRWA